MLPLHSRLTLALLLAFAGNSQATSEPGTTTGPTRTVSCQDTAADDQEPPPLACSEQTRSTTVGAMSPAALMSGVQPMALGVNLFPASGNVGIGTDAPAHTLHMVNTNTPTIRFEQVAGGGYVPYTWDVAANEANFFIRDQSAGVPEQLPFRIAPGNASNTLTLKGSRVGIGTWNPASALHVIGNVQVSNLVNCSHGLITDSDGVFGCASAPQAGAKGPDGDKGPAGDKGAIGDQGPVGDKGPDGNAGASGVDLQQAIAHADAGDQLTRQQIEQVEQNMTQQGSALAAQTLQQANAYTDQQIQVLNDDFQQFRQQMDRRQQATDRRISQIGAMATAMSQMSIHSLPTAAGRGRLAVGVGSQEGQSAMSIGYGKRIGRATFSLGGAFGGGEKNVGAGFGIDL